MAFAEKLIAMPVWAVVGASINPEKYGYIITQRLIKVGKEVFPVNPKPGQINGAKIYTSLSLLPKLPDVVDLVIPPAAALQVVEECAALGINRIWFQPGSRSSKASQRCRELGFEFVDDRCVLAELTRLGM